MDLELFERNGWNVRAVAIDGEPWFVAKDVAESLGYTNTRKAISDHCKGGNESLLPTKGGNQKLTIIPERDVYRLIMRSKLPAAEQFEEWVVGEVLPSIRKTGGYQLQVPQTLPEALRAYADEVEAHAETKALAAEMAPKADFVDKYVDAVGTCTLTTAAKNLGVKRKDLIAVLERDGKLFRRGGRLEPYAEQVKMGRFVIKAGERNGHAYSQLYLTPKGLQHVAETYMPELEV